MKRPSLGSWGDGPAQKSAKVAVAHAATTSVSLVKLLTSTALDLLFPARCGGCGTYGSFICAACEASAPRLEPPFCRTCAQPGAAVGVCIECFHHPPAIDGMRVPFLMRGAIRQVIHSLKYRYVRAVAPGMGGLMARHWIEDTPVQAEALVPVPLHPRRERSRGYNQSALLAREASKKTGLPVLGDVLVRTRDTLPQVGLSYEQRVSNVGGCFAVRGEIMAKRLVLVDDWGRMAIVDTKPFKLRVILHRIFVERPQVTGIPAWPGGAACYRRSRYIL